MLRLRISFLGRLCINEGGGGGWRGRCLLDGDIDRLSGANVRGIGENRMRRLGLAWQRWRVVAVCCHSRFGGRRDLIRDGCDCLIEHCVGGGSEGLGSAGEGFKAGGRRKRRHLPHINMCQLKPNVAVRTVLR